MIFLGVNIDPTLNGYPYSNATGIIKRFSSAGFLELRAQYFNEREPVFIFSEVVKIKWDNFDKCEYDRKLKSLFEDEMDPRELMKKETCLIYPPLTLHWNSGMKVK